jgi:hypothetical protein
MPLSERYQVRRTTGNLMEIAEILPFCSCSRPLRVEIPDLAPREFRGHILVLQLLIFLDTNRTPPASPGTSWSESHSSGLHVASSRMSDGLTFQMGTYVDRHSIHTKLVPPSRCIMGVVTAPSQSDCSNDSWVFGRNETRIFLVVKPVCRRTMMETRFSSIASGSRGGEQSRAEVATFWMASEMSS